jgi:hypothetical protein
MKNGGTAHAALLEDVYRAMSGILQSTAPVEGYDYRPVWKVTHMTPNGIPQLPIEMFRAWPSNPSERSDERVAAADKDLLSSITEHGLITPLQVIPVTTNPVTVQPIEGGRRLRILQGRGDKYVPWCVVASKGLLTAEACACIVNVFRKNWTTQAFIETWLRDDSVFNVLTKGVQRAIDTVERFFTKPELRTLLKVPVKNLAYAAITAEDLYKRAHDIRNERLVDRVAVRHAALAFMVDKHLFEDWKRATRARDLDDLFPADRRREVKKRLRPLYNRISGIRISSAKTGGVTAKG